MASFGLVLLWWHGSCLEVEIPTTSSIRFGQSFSFTRGTYLTVATHPPATPCFAARSPFFLAGNRGSFCPGTRQQCCFFMLLLFFCCHCLLRVFLLSPLSLCLCYCVPLLLLRPLSALLYSPSVALIDPCGSFSSVNLQKVSL